MNDSVPASTLVADWPPPTRGRLVAAELSYLVLSFFLTLGLAIQQLNGQWSRDVFIHIAAIREFSTEGFGAKNPYIATDDPDAYLTPYHLLVGGLDRVGGWSITTTLVIAGLANLVVLLAGLRAFVRLVTERPWAPTFALVFTLFAWGIGPWRWSGYIHMNSLGYGLPYPSTFAIGVGLLSIVGLVRFLRGQSGWYLAGAAAGGVMALLSHPLSAAWLGALACAFVIGSASVAGRRRLLIVGGAGIGLVVVSLAWPYFSLVDLAAASEGWESVHEGLYGRLGLRTFLAIPGVAALWLRARKNARDPLVIGGVLIGLAFVAGIPFDRGTLARMLPGLMLVLHVALADVGGALLDRDVLIAPKIRRVGLVTAAVIVSVGLLGTSAGLLRTLPRAALPSSLSGDERLANVIGPWEPLATVLAEDTVVVAPRVLSAQVAAFGGDLLAPIAPSLRPDEVAARLDARETILADPDSRAGERARRRYGVTHMVLEELPRGVDEGDGRVVLVTPNYVVIELPLLAA